MRISYCSLIKWRHRKTVIGKRKRSRPPRPRALRQENSSPGPQRANRLESNNKQSAPVAWMSPRQLPGKRKTDGQPENEFIHFLVCPAVFSLCALRTARQQSWLPGSGGLQLCFSLRQQLLRRQTQVFCFSFDSKEKRIPFPVKFLFLVSCFNQGIVSQ